MNGWLAEWRLITEEATTLNRAILGFTNSVEHVNRGIYNDLAATVFLPALRATIERARAFAQEHEAALPRGTTIVRDLLDQAPSRFANVAGLGGAVELSAWLTTVCVRAEPYMHDSDATHVHVVERAFLHLQRLIVADRDVRRSWLAAYDFGEVACERLGGCHLLHHGIYGVKANAAHERTDLILGTRLSTPGAIRRAADAMVVTEWKLVRDESDLEDTVNAARTQLARYSDGSLGGFEIASVRFLVTITERSCAELPDEQVGDVTYRHINIVVNPRSPSRS